MPVDRLTPERRRQLTREALVAAAAEVFTAKGFHAASLDEIADAAGFTRGAIYSNFGSKEELLFAVYDRLDDMTLAGMADAIDERGGDPLGNATAAAQVWSSLLGRSSYAFTRCATPRRVRDWAGWNNRPTRSLRHSSRTLLPGKTDGSTCLRRTWPSLAGQPSTDWKKQARCLKRIALTTAV